MTARSMTVPAALSAPEIRWRLRELGFWMFLGTVAMLFAAFTSALVVRRAGGDWRSVALPPILWTNTILLVLSSATMEVSRRIGPRAPRAALFGLTITLALGFAFLGGQLAAWSELRERGVDISVTPLGDFFYVLTGTHAVHLVAALTLLAWLTWRTVRRPLFADWPHLAAISAAFWHFLMAIWICLFALLRAA